METNFLCAKVIRVGIASIPKKSKKQFFTDRVRYDRVRNDRVRYDRVRNDRVRNDRVRSDRVRSDQVRTDRDRNDRVRNDRGLEMIVNRIYHSKAVFPKVLFYCANKF